MASVSLSQKKAETLTLISEKDALGQLREAHDRLQYFKELCDIDRIDQRWEHPCSSSLIEEVQSNQLDILGDILASVVNILGPTYAAINPYDDGELKRWLKGLDQSKEFIWQSPDISCSYYATAKILDYYSENVFWGIGSEKKLSKVGLQGLIGHVDSIKEKIALDIAVIDERLSTHNG